LTFKETCFVEKIKITSKWANMIDVRKCYDPKEDDKPIQTRRKPDKGSPKKVNTKSSKAKKFKKLKILF